MPDFDDEGKVMHNCYDWDCTCDDCRLYASMDREEIKNHDYPIDFGDFSCVHRLINFDNSKEK